MAYSNVPITPGAGADICVDVVSGQDMQVVKLDFGASGASSPPVIDGSGFLKVNLAAQGLGAVVVNNPTAANMKVDASGATVPISAASAIPVSAVVASPVFVRLSSGSAAVDTIPVSGTVTVDQGTAAATASAWPTIISDGTNTVPLDGSNGHALKVSVVATVGPGALADGATFTEGATPITPVGGEYNTGAGAATSGKAAACQITQYRGLHVNLRTAAGAEIGTSGSPVYIQPTGSGTQPVSGTVTATLNAATNAGFTAVSLNCNTGGTQNVTAFAIALPGSGGAVAGGTAANPIRIDPTGTTKQPVNVTQIGGNNVVTAANGVQSVNLTDSGGTAIANTNPLVITHRGQGDTRVTKTTALIASQTGTALWTPAGGKAFYIRRLTITVITSGELQVFDNSNAAGNMVYQGTPPIGAVIDMGFTEPWPSAAVNNVLRWTTGSGMTGDLVVYGFEA